MVHIFLKISGNIYNPEQPVGVLNMRLHCALQAIAKMCVFIPCFAGDKGCVDTLDIESQMDVIEQAVYLKNPSRLLNIYGCIELCRGANTPTDHEGTYNISLAFVTNSTCMCGAAGE